MAPIGVVHRVELRVADHRRSNLLCARHRWRVIQTFLRHGRDVAWDRVVCRVARKFSIDAEVLEGLQAAPNLLSGSARQQWDL